MRKREQQERKDQRRASAASHQILRRDASHSRVQKVREIRSALERAGDMQIVDDAEKFELVEVLGIGTFGQAELRRVADSDGASDGSFIVIKRVPLQKLSDWAIGALVGEVTNGAAMRHPHIVQLFGAYLSRRNELCLALQYAAGGTLDDTIKFQEQRGPFPVDFITTWLSQLCSAVQYMHDQRVLHRDISSGNVFLSFGGDILLGDLGLSRQLGAGDAVGATKVKTQVGTPPYMSPELVTGQDYGTSSDVWAVGVVLFEMLALCRPFTGDNFMTIATLIGKGDPNPDAKNALELSGHPPELRALAGARGLLNPDRQERTPLAKVISLYPMEAKTKEEEDEDAQKDDAVKRLLAGPLRPASQRGPTQLDILMENESTCPPPSCAGSFCGGSSSYAGSSCASSFAPSSYAGSSASSFRSGYSGASSSYMESVTSSTYSSASAFARGQGAMVPNECPILPTTFLGRADIAEKMLPRILADGPHVGLAGATVAFGMGGTGKSCFVASLVRHPAVSSAYQRICWLPVGQMPDLRRLLALLLYQLTRGESGTIGNNEQLGDLVALQQKVVTAMNGLHVLCVLDDVWDPAHMRVLAAPLESAVLVVTTRLHHLLPGAHHVHCGLLTRDESLQLLLRAGDVALPPNATVPQAAKEAVELCGRLPLTIALAGAMLQEHADDWERRLVPLLRGDNRAELRKSSLNEGDNDNDSDDDEESLEGRIITSSLSLLHAKKHHTSVVLFMMCAAFPGDANVAAAVFDALEEPFEKLVSRDATKREKKKKGKEDGEGSYKKKNVRPRKCLKVLLDHSLLQGSIRDGVGMHDLLRVYVLARLSPSELEDLHCDILSALAADLAANPDEPAANEIQAYARAHLEHHAAGACAMTPASEFAPPLDESHPTLMLATDPTAEEWVRLATARGVGLARFSSAAGAAAHKGQWFRVGLLWVATLGLGGPEDQGERRWKAWCALKQVEPVTAASVELEAKVIRGLVLKKGMKINSPEHTEVNARLDELMKNEIAASCADLKAAMQSSKATQFFAILCKASGAYNRDGFFSIYTQFMNLGGSKAALGLGASINAARSCGSLQQLSSHATILHADPRYVWEKDFGPGGSWLKDAIGWYDYSEKKIHEFKSSNGRDTLLCGLGSAMLLLRWGPASGPGASEIDGRWAVCAEAWADIASKVHLGKISWRNHRIDLVDMRAARAVLLSAGHLDDARRLFEASPEGSYFMTVIQGGAGGSEEDAEASKQKVTDALDAHVQSLGQYMSHWQMACTWSTAAYELMARALGALLILLPEQASAGEAASSSAAAAPEVTGEWLPSVEELLKLAEIERAWDVFTCGRQHPSLACACVYAKLKQTAAAQEIAQGLLDMPLRQQLTRYECYMLLARCSVDTEDYEAARLHLNSAAREASGAGYLYLELLATRELCARGGCSSEMVERLTKSLEEAQTEDAAPAPSAMSVPAAPKGRESRRVQWSKINELLKTPDRPKKAGDPMWKSTPGPINRRPASDEPIAQVKGHIPPVGGKSRVPPAVPPPKGKGPEPPDTPHLGGVGILNDAQITRARQLQAAGQGVAGFTRSKHSVKNLNLPLN